MGKIYFRHEHKFIMSGVKGKSGRHKTLKRTIDDQLESLLPLAITKLNELLKKGDREAVIYAINRRLGVPKAVVDNRFSGDIILRAERYKVTKAEIEAIMSSERELLAQYQDVIDGELVSIHNTYSANQTQAQLVGNGTDDVTPTPKQGQDGQAGQAVVQNSDSLEYEI